MIKTAAKNGSIAGLSWSVGSRNLESMFLPISIYRSKQQVLSELPGSQNPRLEQIPIFSLEQVHFFLSILLLFASFLSLFIE